MARADEIRAGATKSLAIYTANPDYQFLCRRVTRLTAKQRHKTCIDNVINYVRGLEMAIAADDLITMRRHEHAERYLDSFPSCAARVRDIKLPENVQMSLFTDYSEDEETEVDFIGAG
jgi:hypothetical protein